MYVDVRIPDTSVSTNSFDSLNMRQLVIALATLAVAAAGCRPSPAPTPARRAPAETPQAADTPGDSAQPAGGGARAPVRPQPYARVITSDYTTRAGLFKAHRRGDRLLYEIPRSELGRDFLLVTQIARTTLGVGYGGQAVSNRVVRWERRDNKVLLRTASFDIMADTSLPIYQAVQAANYNPIVASFNVMTYGPDSAAVVDVSRLFTNPPPELGPGQRLRGSADAQRSFIERVATFPENVEVEATLTYATPAPPPGQGPPAPTPGPFGQGGAQPGAASVLMHWSMVRLPATPMKPRIHDERVGYFSIRQQDYGRAEQRAATRRYITRWRLECSERRVDSLCYPVKPIVYYVDPATPREWVPYVKRGVEDWQRAFEAAGFKEAIIAKDAPSPSEDPDWSAEDARYSVIRWLPSTIENASGPHIHDPRTGEIIESDIQFYHNVQQLLTTWYWVQVGHLDPRADHLPLPDTLMGRLLRVRRRSRGWPHVRLPAQHESELDVSRRQRPQPKLRGTLGTYPDAHGLLAVQLRRAAGGFDSPREPDSRHWSVRQVRDDVGIQARPRANTPTTSARRSIGGRACRTPSPGSASPPRIRSAPIRGRIPRRWETRTRCDRPPSVCATSKRLVPKLITATQRPLEGYADLQLLYDRLINQWALELGHVAAVVGGAESQEKTAGRMACDSRRCHALGSRKRCAF